MLIDDIVPLPNSSNGFPSTQTQIPTLNHGYKPVGSVVPCLSLWLHLWLLSISLTAPATVAFLLLFFQTQLVHSFLPKTLSLLFLLPVMLFSSHIPFLPYGPFRCHSVPCFCFLHSDYHSWIWHIYVFLIMIHLQKCKLHKFFIQACLPIV